MEAMRQGFLSIGVQDNSVLIYSELATSASLFLTANGDTPYFAGFVDLTDGPMVLDVPALGPPTGILGTLDDMWFRWVTDFGVPGPDRAQGGRYLIVGTELHRPVARQRLPRLALADDTRFFILGRAFMIDNDPTRGRGDPQRLPDLEVRARWRGHGDRDVPRRRGTVRADRPGNPRSASLRVSECRSTRSPQMTSAIGRRSTAWCKRAGRSRLNRS